MKLPSLNIQIFIGTFLGVTIGLYFHYLGMEHSVVKDGLYASGLVGTLFIDLLKMVLVPLVLCSITVGIANLRQHRQIHRVWVTTLLFFLSSTAIAIIIGMSASLYFKPGSGLHLAMFEHAMQNYEAKQLPISDFFAQFLHGLFVNPCAKAAKGLTNSPCKNCAKKSDIGNCLAS